MIPLRDPLWAELRDAYGPARSLPDLLAVAQRDRRGAHEPDTPWFDLWSALCHQGDAYSASYAAVPHLAAFATERRHSPAQFDPLFLIACIELARLEGRGPPIPEPLAPAYYAALPTVRALVHEALMDDWDDDYREALKAGLAALDGNPAGARAILDAGLDEDG